MYKLLCLSFIALWLLFGQHSAAQSVELGKEDVLQQPNPVYLNHALFYLDETNTLGPEQVAQKKFSPFSFYFSKVPDQLPANKTYWMKLNIRSEYVNDTSIVFYPGFQNYVQVYYAAGGRFSRITICGNFTPASQLTIPDTRQATMLPLSAGVDNQFYISFKNVTTYEVDPFRPIIMSRASLDDLQAKKLKTRRLPDAVFFTGIGMFLIMFIYIFIKWIYQKDSAYFFYALSIISGAIYFLLAFFKQENNPRLFKENPLLIHLVADSFVFITVYAYTQFVRKFLYLHKEKPSLDKFLKYWGYLILFLCAVSLTYAFASKNVSGIILLDSTIGLFFLFGGIYTLYAIRNVNQSLRRFVYGGILFLLFFYGLGSIYEAVRGTPYEFLPALGGGTPLLMIGNITEMLFFTLGLAYRNKQEAEQLAGIQVQKADAEMKALRTQMNPHFIFNCMNTIDAYIFKEQPEKASRFLNTFSKLIRKTLDNSQQSFISLQNEIDSLKLFTDLEQERFDNSFDVQYKISDDIKNSSYKIPPLLIQPYAENAILHGLRHKKNGRGLLEVSVHENETAILIHIKDNGIGRAASQQLKEINGKTHTSVAMELTQQRLSLLNNTAANGIKIIDHTPETGTEVIITLPKIT
jgi:sensor histidine kinase YesM